MVATPPPPRSADAIVQALDRKRKQLDKEIADFKAKKEKEYADYEEELRKTVDVGTNSDTIAPPGKGVATRQSEGQKTKEKATSKLGSSQQTAADKNSSKSATPTEERDLELRSLFTPSYLPLLEDPQRDSRKQSKSSSRSPKSKPDLAPSPLPHSFTLPSTTYSAPSPPTKAPSLPASVSRPSLADRRSSSKSDTSVTSPGLRSSMRQPKSPQQEAQKDKKHVLFSIDNMVISPSSSPVLQRHRPLGSSASTPRSGVGDDDDDDDDLRFGARGDFQTQFTRVTPPSSYSTTSPLSQSMARNYQNLVEPTGVTSPSPADEEDFAMNAGSDPLFEFDEEVQSLPDDAGERGRRTSTEDSDNEAPGGTQSPHVGSLPIEIRWPGRRGS
ncbi:MAG: hypothetical protein MMC23_000597 [Stictis urceolatum]|nr:hypothetical protein [Stictis urceolata]